MGTRDEWIERVLDSRQKWLNGEDGGERADLRRACLEGINGDDLSMAIVAEGGDRR